LKVELKYDDSGLNAISGLTRISKPGRRVYSKHTDIPKIMSGLGVSVVSTSQGLMTDRKARAQKIGGEILCAIW
jgi:small subunit ribosomal protein S8